MSTVGWFSSQPATWLIVRFSGASSQPCYGGWQLGRYCCISSHGVNYVLCGWVALTATTKRTASMAKKASKKKAASKSKKVVQQTGGFNPIPPQPDTGRLLTPAQAAQMCNISTRTLARWALAFSDSLSEHASREGRKRFFSSADIETLRKAESYIQDGMTIADAAALLPVVDPEEEKTTALMLSPEVALQVGQIIEVTDTLKEEMYRLRDKNDRLEERNIRLEQKNERNEDRLQRLEARARQPFWRRLFPPSE